MGRLIVHVDDDPDIREAVNTVLSGAGHTVRSYETIEVFLASVEQEKPDLAILDVMVEKDDSGLVGYDQMRTKLPGTPVILLSSLGGMVLPHFDGRSEAVTVMEKPIEPAKLLAIVSKKLGV